MRLFISLFVCLFICESSFAARDYTAYFYKAQSSHAPEKTFYLALLAFVAQSKNKNGSVEPIKKTTYRVLKLTDAYPEAEKIKNHTLYEVLSSAQLFSNKKQKLLINDVLGNPLLVSDEKKINEIRKIFDNSLLDQQGELFFRDDDCSRLYQAYGELIYQDKVEKYDGAKDMIGNWARALLYPIYTYLEIEGKDDKQKVCNQILGNEFYKPSIKLSEEITKIIDEKKSRREVQMQERDFQDILTFSPVTEEDESKLMLQLFDKKTKSALDLTDVPSEEKGGASI